MKRVLVAIFALSPMLAAAYACSTDTFTGDGGTEGGGNGPATSAEFCDAETVYVQYCGFDAACVQNDLKNCGAAYSAFSPAFATALAHCMERRELLCTGEFTKGVTSACITQELDGATNNGSELSNLAKDYCDRCAKNDKTCTDTFATSPQPGYLASLFSDGVIKQMDDCEKKLDGGLATSGDAAFTCLEQTVVCESLAIAASYPKSTCNDN